MSTSSAEDEPASHLPLHLIRPVDVDTWLADSAVKRVTFHRTSAQAARDLIEYGVDIARCSPDGAWGRGFYSAIGAGARYGPVAVPVAIRLLNALVLMDTIRGAEIIDELMAQFGLDEIESAIMSAGFDGVVLHLGSDEMWVVAYRGDQVRIVIEERA